MYGKKDVENRIWEYFLKEGSGDQEEIDEFLIRLFSRKGNIITNKEREGFTHIKFMDMELELIYPKTVSGGALVSHVQLKIIDNKTEFDCQIPSLVDFTETYRVRIRAYLFLNLSRTEEMQKKCGFQECLTDKLRYEMSVARSAVVLALIEPITENAKKGLCSCECYGSAPGLYVDMEYLKGIANNDKAKNTLGTSGTTITLQENDILKKISRNLR